MGLCDRLYVPQAHQTLLIKAIHMTTMQTTQTHKNQSWAGACTHPQHQACTNLFFRKHTSRHKLCMQTSEGTVAAPRAAERASRLRRCVSHHQSILHITGMMGAEWMKHIMHIYTTGWKKWEKKVKELLTCWYASTLYIYSIVWCSIITKGNVSFISYMHEIRNEGRKSCAYIYTWAATWIHHRTEPLGRDFL